MANASDNIDNKELEESAEQAPGLRKIIHVDMDAFFASVEQRDFPELRGKPVAVGGTSGRGVVAAASYEARRFGVKSAMPSATARRLCPDLIFCKSRFDVYRQVSQQVRAIFRHFTSLVEPLSIDEAFLDVTQDERGIGNATRIAQLVRDKIREETRLTASAGISYNKFLAKLASDQNKPNGQFVIRPGEGAGFVAGLPIRRFYGIGPKGAEKMSGLGIETGADLAGKDIAFLREHFGSQADYLFRAARGIDLRPVRVNRPRKSLGGERTYGTDISSGAALRDALEQIIEIVWERIERANVQGRTVTLKLKYSDFQIVNRSRSLPDNIADRREFTQLSYALLEEMLPLPQPIRLMGLTLSNLQSPQGEDEGNDEKGEGSAQLSLL